MKRERFTVVRFEISDGWHVAREEITGARKLQYMAVLASVEIRAKNISEGRAAASAIGERHYYFAIARESGFRGVVVDYVDPAIKSEFYAVVDLDSLTRDEVSSLQTGTGHVASLDVLEEIPDLDTNLDQFHVCWETGETVGVSSQELTRGITIPAYDMQDALVSFEGMQCSLSREIQTNKHFKIKYILRV